MLLGSSYLNVCANKSTFHHNIKQLFRMLEWCLYGPYFVLLGWTWLANHRISVQIFEKKKTKENR